MSEIFEKPIEEVKVPDIEESAPAPPVKEKKARKSHITEERKAELKQIRIEALKKGREAKKMKREAEAKAKAEAQETKTEEEKPLLENNEIVEEKPKKAEKKPKAYKSINSSEIELLKKEKRIKELEYENETNMIKQEIICWKNENRLLKEKLDKMEKEKPVPSEEKKVVFREKQVEEKPKPKIVLPEKEKKKFITRRGFKY